MKSKETIVIKYGGNAMVNEDIKRSVMQNICRLHESGYRVVVVHGGGPFINKILEKVQITSEFIGGHRKTSPEAMKYIEMALVGEVNTGLVTLINQLGSKAVGLSGKDGGLAWAKKRWHEQGAERIDLGQVGNIERIDPTLLDDLLSRNYIPVIACIAPNLEGHTFNINADMMAGAIAGALKADQYFVLTDVEGLLRDKNDVNSLIQELNYKEIPQLFDKVIVGGMIPKIESCMIALDEGAKMARIINGTRENTLTQSIIEQRPTGTIILK